MKKRYQYISKNGIKWTDWFNCNSRDKPEIQLKMKLVTLKNEYKEAVA